MCEITPHLPLSPPFSVHRPAHRMLQKKKKKTRLKQQKQKDKPVSPGAKRPACCRTFWGPPQPRQRSRAPGDTGSPPAGHRGQLRSAPAPPRGSGNTEGSAPHDRCGRSLWGQLRLLGLRAAGCLDFVSHASSSYSSRLGCGGQVRGSGIPYFLLD